MSTCKKDINLASDLTVNNKSHVMRGAWREYPSHGLLAPDCLEAPWSRDNHLGNGWGGFANTYNWTVPEGLNHEFCVIRMR